MTVSVTVNWEGDRIRLLQRRGAKRGVRKATEHLLEASRRRVPLEEGTLERSGVAIVDGLEGTVSYDTIYAVRQHEELDWKHAPGRTAKYLEGPFEEEKDVMMEIIAAEIRRGIFGR